MNKEIDVAFVTSKDQLADIFTKMLSRELFYQHTANKNRYVQKVKKLAKDVSVEIYFLSFLLIIYYLY